MTIVENLFILGRKNSIRPSMMMMMLQHRPSFGQKIGGIMEAKEAKEEN
jgi:hypothetical protein